jgi:hypothetical protein
MLTKAVVGGERRGKRSKQMAMAKSQSQDIRNQKKKKKGE